MLSATSPPQSWQISLERINLQFSRIRCFVPCYIVHNSHRHQVSCLPHHPSSWELIADDDHGKRLPYRVPKTQLLGEISSSGRFQSLAATGTSFLVVSFQYKLISELPDITVGKHGFYHIRKRSRNRTYVLPRVIHRLQCVLPCTCTRTRTSASVPSGLGGGIMPVRRSREVLSKMCQGRCVGVPM